MMPDCPNLSSMYTQKFTDLSFCYQRNFCTEVDYILVHFDAEFPKNALDGFTMYNFIISIM